MIFDAQTLMSNAQAITASAPSTNIIDTGAPGTIYGVSSAIAKDFGKGADIPLFVQVVTAFNNLTSLQVDFQSADDTGFSTNLKTITMGTYLLATLVAGRNMPFDEVPMGATGRYWRINYTVTGTAPTTGAVTAGLMAGVQSNAANFG